MPSVITGSKLTELNTLALGTSGNLFYTVSEVGNSYKMSTSGLFQTLSGMYLDNSYVNRTNNQVITGSKKFTTPIGSDKIFCASSNSATQSFIALGPGTGFLARTIAPSVITLDWVNRSFSGDWTAQNIIANKLILNSTGNAPSTYTSPGTSGQFALSGSFLFVHTGNGWGKVQLTPA